jgi:23S rRNA pseudouridine2604 synthase
MTFRKRLQYFLVKKLQISNKNALALISAGKVLVNDVPIFENVEVRVEDSIRFQDEVLQVGKQLLYVAFYKPRGIETTLNEEIEDNLKAILPFKEELFPVGRLDKESEGLLIMTNDGRLFDKTLRSEHQTEKEYIVTVNQAITEEFLFKMASGITILGKQTLPCKIEKISEFTFSIVLVQGMNRQIRRMCYKLNYEVTKLVRVRIGDVLLRELQPSEYYFFKSDSIKNQKASI